MAFDFSGILGLFLLATFPCLALIMGRGLYGTLRGWRLLARIGRHEIGGLREFWGGLLLLLLALFLFTMILSLHTTDLVLALLFLLGAVAFFLLDIAIYVYWETRIQQNMF
jgi:hypothetical protein